MIVTFLGLAGAHGPLPSPYTELIIERLKRRDTTLRDFLDIFNHRLISMMVRIRRKHRLALEARAPEDTQFARYLYALMGLGTTHFSDRQRFDERVFLGFTGLLLRRTRSLAGLASMLGEYFRVPIRGEQMVGRWYPLDTDARSAIGRTGANQRLGRGVLLGRRVWDQQSCFVLNIGPLDEDRFLSFLPIGPNHADLAFLIRFYVGTITITCQLRLILRTTRLPGARLSSRQGQAAMLGWTSWLKADVVTGSPSIQLQLGD